MRFSIIFRSLGLLLSIFSTSMLPPILVALWYKEDTVGLFSITFIQILIFGLLLYWMPFFPKPKKKILNVKDGFLVVVIFWATLCIVGAVPFVLSTAPDISFIDALFESVSGITATGATVLSNLDNLPRSILYYRQQLQFLGGMGVVLLAVAILPTLGIGGMQLFRAEMTGPLKDNKLTPKIAQSAKGIWMIYIGLTIFCAISYWAAGMDLFDAIGFSFGTVSTGGYTTHDLSFGYYNSQLLQVIATFFMIAGALSFALHFLTLHYGSFKYYWKNIEAKTLILLILIATILVTITLLNTNTYENSKQALIQSLFHVTSLATTTGFSSTRYDMWPSYIPLLLLILGLMGGCAGSTSGGIKLIRIILLNKQGFREIKRLIHPNGHFVIKFGKKPINNRVIDAIWGFLATYMALFILFLLLLETSGLDFLTSFSATAAALSNIGPGLGAVASNYQEINDFAKIILSFAMLVGRLELFTVLVLLTPNYWRN